MRANVQLLERIVRAAGGAVERIVGREAELLHSPAHAADVIEVTADRRS